MVENVDDLDMDLGFGDSMLPGMPALVSSDDEVDLRMQNIDLRR